MAGHSHRLGPLGDLAARYFDTTSVAPDPIIQAELDRRRTENDVLAAMLAIKRARAERRAFTALEQELLLCAEGHVRCGVQPPATFRPIARSGFRRHQTQLSLADDGAGHLAVTLRDPELLDGVIVHHEVIARTGSGGAPDPALAPYRLIDIRQNGVLRLHAADDVPVTVYGGRPTFQFAEAGEAASDPWDLARAYRHDAVTPAHIAAATASAAFANGVADVKFSLDGLTVSQAIDFMQRVRRAVDCRADQSLSTQFNLNRPLCDDRPCQEGLPPALVAEPVAIAELSVTMTQAGGWDRVTLDSASRTFPSVPFTDLLGFAATATWVMQAHAAGLETYISGGMSERHIQVATHAGVDGVGIGLWIHHHDRQSGEVGTLDSDRIRQAIRARNEAEVSPCGMAARLLARLQAGAWSGACADDPAPLSSEAVLAALLARDDARLAALLARAGAGV